MAARDPDVRRLAASIASNTHVAGLDAGGRRAMTEAGRAALLRQLEDQVDPGRQLEDDERERRVRALRRARMSELALRSVKARKARAEASEQAEYEALLQATGEP